ncbi:MAG: hypothetical protein ACTSWY_03215 [Promethearchaeota archaeon]
MGDECCGSNDCCCGSSDDCCCGGDNDCCGSNNNCCGNNNNCCGGSVCGGLIILGIFAAIIMGIFNLYNIVFGENAGFAGIISVIIIISVIAVTITVYVLINRRKKKKVVKEIWVNKGYEQREHVKVKKETLKMQKKKDKDAIQKIKKMMGVSTRIRIDMMRDTIGMDSKEFNEKIWNWAEKFGFTINGDYIVIEGADIDGFISDLDKQFKLWGDKEKSKNGKTK